MIKRIAITGPESTGKSTLAENLADHYKTVWVPEYAREYIDKLDRPYIREDILAIAKKQLENENKIAKTATRFLFCDSELIVTKIWSEDKYKSCDEWILRKIEEHKYDLYLLCYIDLPWQDDPQREDPHRREYLFDLYLQELTERDLPFFVISGSGKKRLKNAVKQIESFFAGKKY
jgi:NadR type nicotinamide-nucleotide adenylyltransferase